MARLEATRKGGFYAAPVELLPTFASLVKLAPGKAHFVCDPCAGAGEALEGLIGSWTSNVRGMDDTKVVALTCEVEATRQGLLMGRVTNPDSSLFNQSAHTTKFQHLHGDAFRTGWKPEFGGLSALWLNPPYDVENAAFKLDKGELPQAKRTEEEWLRHFHPFISNGGALLFFLPFNALKASAATLAMHFEDFSCYRTPEPIFTDYYRQVVLVARKRPALLKPDPLWKSIIEEWSADASNIPELPMNGRGFEPLVVHSNDDHRWINPEIAGWKIWPFEVRDVLRSARLWCAPSRSGELSPIEAVIPSDPFDKLFARKYPLAMPPRATHIGAAISAGVMGGVRLVPNKGSEHLPTLYIGGHFEKAFKTVEERTNKEGDVSSYVQVEQPILRIQVLDTSTATYYTLKNEVAETDATTIANFTAGDLLKSYGDSMVAELKKRCPPLYDPSDPKDLIDVPIAEGRMRFEAQEHAIRATVKLLQQGPDYSAILVGEVGSGKSQCSITCARMMERDHVLVMAPPHLGSTWKTQVESAWPGARAIMLETTTDMDDFVAHDAARRFVSGRPEGSKLDGHCGPVVGVLSRETAKLGHRHTGIGNGAWKSEKARLLLKDQDQLKETGYCPKCGTPIYDAPDDLAKRRSRCSAKFKRPSNKWAEWTRRIAVALVPVAAGVSEVAEKLLARGEQLFIARRRVIASERAAAKLPAITEKESKAVQSKLGDIAHEMAPSMVVQTAVYARSKDPHPMRAFVRLLFTCGDDRDRYDAIMAFYDAGQANGVDDYRRHDLYNIAKSMLVTIQDKAIFEEAKSEMKKTAPPPRDGTYGYRSNLDDWSTVETDRARLWGTHFGTVDPGMGHISIGCEVIQFTDDGTPTINGQNVRSVSLAVSAIRELSVASTYLEDTKECGEALYQAYARPLGKGELGDGDEKASPRRIALAYYFSKRLRRKLRRGKWMLITDEVHELANNEDSAQSKAAQQLWNLKMPTIAMTGSVMNGYPSSIFILLWSLSSAFREEFSRKDGPLYSKTFGYQKQLVVVEDGRSKVKEFGAFSDKTDDEMGRAKNAGFSPGMLPASTLKHALRRAVTLQLRDIAKSLPPCHFAVEQIAPTADQDSRAVSLLTRINDQIKKDRYTPDSGKLMGALTEAPSFLDRCIRGVGNQEDGTWRSEYPDGRIVWSFEGYEPESRLPKEKWLLDYLDNQLSSGRDVIVLAWHLNLLPRLRTIIEKDLKIIAPILYSEKVAPKKREAWIQKELDGKGARVFLCNPVSISTGLNALIRFSSVAWYESPACNPMTYRQANGRIIRIGQKQDQHIVTPVYGVDGNSKVNVQGLMHRLLMHKVGVSEGIEGLDPAAALTAAGVGDQDSLAGRDIGRLLSSMLDGDDASLRMLQREFITRLSSKTDAATEMGGVV